MSRPYRTTLTGAFPRTEELVQATRDLDRKRITPEAAEEEFVRAQARVDELEARMGFDSRTGGYLRWPDMFRPFTSLWSGVHAGTLTRFFETNTFYRQPVFDARPQALGSGLAAWLPHGQNARAILPGPHTFAHLSDLRYPGADPLRGTGDIASALAEEIRALGSARPAHIQFQEPLLAYRPLEGNAAALKEAYRVLKDACGASTVSVWTYFGDVGPSLPALLSLPVDVVGFDLFEWSGTPTPDFQGKGVGLGVVESRTTIPEDLAGVSRLVRELERSSNPSSVWLGPSPPLDLLPFAAAESKVGLLPKLKEALAQ